MKTAAEINAEKIEAIIEAHNNPAQGIVVGYDFRTSDALKIARRIVEAFPQLQPPQFTSERDGTSRTIVHPLPWSRP